MVTDGVDALALLTPLIEKRRRIILWSILLALLVGALAALMPRKYKAELSLTPVVNNKSANAALGGLAAIAGATLNPGVQLTPAKMVELLKSRTVLAGVGFSTMPDSKERVIDRVLGKKYERNDEEEVEKQLEKTLSVSANKETGTISVSVLHKDSALARVIAARVVDSASHIFVSTSKAQAQQLRIAQEARVKIARDDLATAEEHLRQFRFANRAAPPFSAVAVEQERLSRDIQLAEQVYTQAVSDQQAAYARELEETPTVVVQDRLPPVLPKVRKRIILKTIIAGFVSFVLICIGVLIAELTTRRLARTDSESDRFKRAVSTLPRIVTGKTKQTAVSGKL
jgi:uncharacterized protein involved in exopolysaccharide biosynthesis